MERVIVREGEIHEAGYLLFPQLPATKESIDGIYNHG
jgi:hypothetical protein